MDIVAQCAAPRLGRLRTIRYDAPGLMRADPSTSVLRIAELDRASEVRDWVHAAVAEKPRPS